VTKGTKEGDDTVKEHEPELSDPEGSEGQPEIEVGVEQPQGERKMPQDIPLLPVRDVVVYPFMILPLFVGRTSPSGPWTRPCRASASSCWSRSGMRRPRTRTPEDVYDVGTVAMIMRMLKMPDGRVKILVQGVSRAPG